MTSRLPSNPQGGLHRTRTLKQKGDQMKNAIRFSIAAALASLLALLVLPTFTISTLAFAPVGAPGPIAGAGLPFLAVGFGVFWLVKRHRKAD
jgi:hypothetical protein